MMKSLQSRQTAPGRPVNRWQGFRPLTAPAKTGGAALSLLETSAQASGPRRLTTDGDHFQPTNEIERVHHHLIGCTPKKLGPAPIVQLQADPVDTKISESKLAKLQTAINSGNEMTLTFFMQSVTDDESEVTEAERDALAQKYKELTEHRSKYVRCAALTCLVRLQVPWTEEWLLQRKLVEEDTFVLEGLERHLLAIGHNKIQNAEKPIYADETRAYWDQVLDVPSAMATLYYNQRLFHQVLKIQFSIDQHSTELPFRALIRLADQKSYIARDVLPLFYWLRIYLLVVINKEIIHQKITATHPRLSLPSQYRDSKDGKTKSENFAQQAPTNAIVDFLKEAKLRFAEPSLWHLHWGGKNWEMICEIAELMWSEEDLGRRMGLMDRVFQLQHNLGSIFTKLSEGHLIFSYCAVEEQILDLKFSARSIDEFEDGLALIFDPSEYAVLRSRYETLSELESLAKKTI